MHGRMLGAPSIQRAAVMPTMNGVQNPFDYDAPAAANRYADAIRCTAAETRTTIASCTVLSPEGHPTYLRVSPSLAATGFREIQPISRVLLRAKADALTGIKRADTANEIQYRPAKSNNVFCRWLAGRERNSTARLAVDASTRELNWKFPRGRSSVAWLEIVSTADVRLEVA
jgi:hypothetical protein